MVQPAMGGPTVPLRTLREAHYLTLDELRKRIDERGVRITVSALSATERGKKRASNRLLAAWAQALGIHPLDVQRPLTTADMSITDDSDDTEDSVPA